MPSAGRRQLLTNCSIGTIRQSSPISSTSLFKFHAPRTDIYGRPIAAPTKYTEKQPFTKPLPVRWTVACCRLDDGNSLRIVPLEQFGNRVLYRPLPSSDFTPQEQTFSGGQRPPLHSHTIQKRSGTGLPVPLLIIFRFKLPISRSYRLPCLLDRTSLGFSASSALSQGSTSPGSFR